jgi:hypothetical protein
VGIPVSTIGQFIRFLSPAPYLLPQETHQTISEIDIAMSNAQRSALRLLFHFLAIVPGGMLGLLVWMFLFSSPENTDKFADLLQLWGMPLATLIALLWMVGEFIWTGRKKDSQ